MLRQISYINQLEHMVLIFLLDVQKIKLWIAIRVPETSSQTGLYSWPNPSFLQSIPDPWRAIWIKRTNRPCFDSYIYGGEVPGRSFTSLCWIESASFFISNGERRTGLGWITQMESRSLRWNSSASCPEANSFPSFSLYASITCLSC